MLERHYTVAVEETPDEYVMTLTARGASGVTGVHRLGKQGAFTGEGPQVPPGAELTPAELEGKKDNGYRLGDVTGRRGVERAFE